MDTSCDFPQGSGSRFPVGGSHTLWTHPDSLGLGSKTKLVIALRGCALTRSFVVGMIRCAIIATVISTFADAHNISSIAVATAL